VESLWVNAVILINFWQSASEQNCKARQSFQHLEDLYKTLMENYRMLSNIVIRDNCLHVNRPCPGVD
jgi:hypothetical protein